MVDLNLIHRERCWSWGDLIRGGGSPCVVTWSRWLYVVMVVNVAKAQTRGHVS